MPTPTVTPAWLLAHLASEDLRVLDVRWSLQSGAQRAAYNAGHVPGAVFVDLDADLAGRPGPEGRHPLPPLDSFCEAMRQAGVSSTSSVVIYDEVTGAAARAWWLLTSCGHRQVAVLDGGLSAYLASGGELTDEPTTVSPGDLTASQFARTIPADLIEVRQDQGHLVLDARARERYLGERNPLDPRPGHLPGARSLPWTDLYPEGLLLERQEIRRRLREAGHNPEQPVVAYCGSGVTACALLLGLAASGVEHLYLYPGSWSEWAADPSRPVSTED
jgi:thiosulfate/3-mercaptopyruvate sulfurtransferase